MSGAGTTIDTIEEETTDDIVWVTHQVIENADRGCRSGDLDCNRHTEFERRVEREEHLLHALFDRIKALMVRRAEQVSLGYTADRLDVFCNLAGLQQATIAGLGALADLDQDTGRIFNHVRHRLGDTVPAKVAGSDLQDHVLQVLALEQTNRDTTLTGAHAHRHAALLVEVGDRHGHRFPHPPGERTDRHVTDNHRVNPAYRRHLCLDLQVVLSINTERQRLWRHDATKRCQHVEGMPLGIEARVGHLRDATDAQLVQSAN